MSRYLIDYNAAFLHIPRTGGTWIELVLRAAGLLCRHLSKAEPLDLPKNHRMLGHYRGFERPVMAAKFLFTFVRHPIPYYESVWKWINANRNAWIKKRWKWHPFCSPISIYRRRPEFADWVEGMLEEEPCWATRLFEGYVGPEGGEFVDFVGRTCSLREDLCQVFDLLRIPTDRPFIMIYPQVNCLSERLEWPPGLQERLLKSERVILRRWFSKDVRCSGG